MRIRGWQTDGFGGNWAELIVPTTIIGTIPPQVTSQPQGVILSEGLAANLSTTYTGHEPISLQWYKEDVEISGATNAVFIVPKIAQKDAGRYRLRLINSVKTVFSDWAEINVQAAQVSRSISGKVEYYLSTQGGVKGVSLNITEGGGRSAVSAVDGSYTIDAPDTGVVTLTPTYATDAPIANGVTTADITLIRRHVLGLTLLDSPYKVMAGDVNGSDSVTTADITLIRRLILGTATTFSGGLWRFVPSDEAFTNTAKPWTATRMRQYASLASGTLSGQDFKAIKLGDVNGSWKAPTATAGSILKSKAKGRLTVGKVTAATGDVVGIPIKAEGFAAVTSMQFTMRWDPSQLQFVSAGNFELPGLTVGNFNSLKMQEGLLTFSWDPPSGQGVELTTISELFQVQMKVLAAGGATAEMAWSELPTPTEVTVDFSPVETDKVIGGVTVTGGTVVTPESLVLKVLGVSADGRLELSVRAPLGVTVVLEASDSLLSWAEVQSVTGEGFEKPAALIRTEVSVGQERFWRLRVR